jgi:hypothetical protein
VCRPSHPTGSLQEYPPPKRWRPALSLGCMVKTRRFQNTSYFEPLGFAWNILANPLKSTKIIYIPWLSHVYIYIHIYYIIVYEYIYICKCKIDCQKNIYIKYYIYCIVFYYIILNYIMYGIILY